MIGELDRSGVGVPCDVDKVKNVAELQASCAVSNTALLKEMRENSNAETLFDITRTDASLGRMSEPKLVDETSLNTVLLNPRFGVEQIKDDGSTRVRPIDHLSWSPSTMTGEVTEGRPTKKARKEASVNGHTAASEKMRHDTLDALTLVMRLHVEMMGSVPGLIKVYISSVCE